MRWAISFPGPSVSSERMIFSKLLSQSMTFFQMFLEGLALGSETTGVA